MSSVVSLGSELFLYFNCGVQGFIGLDFVLDPPVCWSGKRCREAQILGLAFLVCALLSVTAERAGRVVCLSDSL